MNATTVLGRASLSGALVVALAAACTTNTGGLHAAPPTPTINHAELQRLSGLSAYEAVERLLPQVIWERPGTYPRSRFEALPQVYAGQQWLGDITYLHYLSATQLIEVRYLKPLEAMQRHGREAPRGALELILRR